ncbi:MAG: alpha/beta fold hydrolase [Anaerolineales bacterium]|nr:alpha/beta fold hydrolase [Anaerolineales bacterium]MCB9127789.1 alpha/beta fold hydrolase [Ardenticatenales bacterium]
MDNRPLLPIRIGGEPIGIPTIAALWANEYHLDHRRFYVTTRDDVRIAGIYLDRADTDSLVIYVHGFMAGKDHHHVPRFVQAFSHFFDVMAIDLRGHGESGGGCTMGEMEVLDVEATIQYARSLGYEHITTIGSSMGGATVIRHAALHQSQNAVVTIGAFADVSDIGRPNSDYGLHLLYNSGRLGEMWSYVTRGTRLANLRHHQTPLQLVGQVAPLPLLLIHGEWDVTVHPRAAQLLYDAAREPKRMILVERGGHDAPHLTAATAQLIRDWMIEHGVDRAQ